MNAMQTARSAYSGVRAGTRTARDVEYQVFSRITRDMRRAIDDPSAGFPSLVAALHENRKLWNTLAADVADTQNGLPDMLRARILFLAEFTHHETDNILSGGGNARTLVDINMAVMRGLGNQREVNP